MMNTVDLTELLCSAIAQACNVARSRVGVETNLLDLNMDSLTFVSILTQIEAVYAIELTPDEIISVLETRTVSELIGKVESSLHAAADRSAQA